MNYLFTSESVSEGHPDKLADQISDAVLDELLAHDPDSKVACETLVTTGQIVVAGEIRSKAYIDIMDVARRVAVDAGYDRSDLGFDGNSCGVLLAVHEQSPDINRGVDRATAEEQGAGDQGMMFGYATDETPLYIPVTLALSHALLKELSAIRREGKVMTYLRPDSKSQVTVEYTADGRPVRVDTIVISTQHDEFVTPAATGASQAECDAAMQQTIADDVRRILLPREGTASLGCVSDLGAGATYGITPAIDVFARVDNILGRRHMLLPGIESRGLHGLAGVQLKF